MASHGTDQLLVQRLLGCRSKSDSQKALVLDATLIVLQFLFFLILGLCLYAFYDGASLAAMGLTSSDEIFPHFIVEQLPAGITGFVIAGVLASAMGSLSSSISSLASSTCLDLLTLTTGEHQIGDRRGVFWSRFFTLFWGIVLIGGAMLFRDTKSPVVELGLKIASITYGALLGTFFLGLLARKTMAVDAFIGFIAAITVMVAVLFFTTVDYTWHTFIGCAVSIAAGTACRAVRSIIARNGENA